MLLSIILPIFVIAVVAILLLAATKPDQFCVTRSLSIQAPAEKIFELVNDFHLWQEWSPWAKLDPQAQNSFEGPRSGVGAIMRWNGNNKVGQGSNTIIESRPAEVIKMQLEFLKPFKATNSAEFTFQTDGEQTLVRWSMSGKNNFVGKIFSLVFNCDKMVGGQFEKGLAQLKALTEEKRT